MGTPADLRHPPAANTATSLQSFVKSVGQVVGLLDLREGWNSHSAKPVEARNAVRAVELLFQLRETGAPPPVVVPTVRGGIQLEWHANGVDPNRTAYRAAVCHNHGSGVSTSFRYTVWVVASRLRNRNVRLRESCEWPPSRPTREFIAVAAFGRQLRESDALRSPTPRQSSNLGIRFLVDAFARPQHLVAT